MKKKIRSQRGETLVEVLASLVVVIMIISMLPMALETAARINHQVKSMETICQRTMAEDKKIELNVEVYNASGSKVSDLNVQGYAENGFTYYVAAE